MGRVQPDHLSHSVGDQSEVLMMKRGSGSVLYVTHMNIKVLLILSGGWENDQTLLQRDARLK